MAVRTLGTSRPDRQMPHTHPLQWCRMATPSSYRNQPGIERDAQGPAQEHWIPDASPLSSPLDGAERPPTN